MSEPQRLAPWRPLTARQTAVRDAIAEIRSASNREPGVTEIARHMGHRSHSYVGRVVRKLRVRSHYPQ